MQKPDQIVRELETLCRRYRKSYRWIYPYCDWPQKPIWGTALLTRRRSSRIYDGYEEDETLFVRMRLGIDAGYNYITFEIQPHPGESIADFKRLVRRNKAYKFEFSGDKPSAQIMHANFRPKDAEAITIPPHTYRLRRKRKPPTSHRKFI